MSCEERLRWCLYVPLFAELWNEDDMVGKSLISNLRKVTPPPIFRGGYPLTNSAGPARLRSHLPGHANPGRPFLRSAVNAGEWETGVDSQKGTEEVRGLRNKDQGRWKEPR